MTNLTEIEGYPSSVEGVTPFASILSTGTDIDESDISALPTIHTTKEPPNTRRRPTVFHGHHTIKIDHEESPLCGLFSTLLTKFDLDDEQSLVDALNTKRFSKQ